MYSNSQAPGFGFYSCPEVTVSSMIVVKAVLFCFSVELSFPNKCLQMRRCDKMSGGESWIKMRLTLFLPTNLAVSMKAESRRTKVVTGNSGSKNDIAFV